MPEYKIKIRYETGDSFGTETCENYIDGEWKNLDIVHENAKRIKEHYRWYNSFHGYPVVPGKAQVKRPSWLLDSMSENSIKLILDNGSEYIYSTFWCGYFETLYAITIEEVPYVYVEEINL